jgi:hypothetical protein
MKARLNMLEQFADQHRLRAKTDDCGEVIIPGKIGQLYQHSENELGVLFMPAPTPSEPWGQWKPKTWGNAKRKAIAAGMTLRQDGDSEGCLSFDPANKIQAKLAISIAGVRPKRQMTAEQLDRLSAMRLKARQTLVETPYSA